MDDLTGRDAFEAAAATVTEVFVGYFTRLQDLATEVLAVYHSTSDDRGVVREDQLDVVRVRAEEWLQEEDAALGYGFVAAPGAVEGRERCMMWFQRTESGVRRLVLNFDPQDIDVYDYLDMEWFTHARDRLNPVVFGPYFDYSGSDQYVLTFSVPVLDGEQFLGVAGADLVAADLEPVVRPTLRQLPSETVIVDAERRVVFSNTARWIPGDRLARHPLTDPMGFPWVTELLPGVGWAAASDPGRPR